MAGQGLDEKRRPAALNLTPARTGTSSSTASDNSLKAPRTPRFAEATSVHSPVDGKSPFADPEPTQTSYIPQAQPADVGFGYLNGNRESVAVPMTPKTPLKSAMKVPGTPMRQFTNPLSPTFREEEMLEKREASTDKEQIKDLVSYISWKEELRTRCVLELQLTPSLENQDACSNGKIRPAWCQL